MHGQGATEYLLLIVGALAIVVVAALLINSLLSPPMAQRDVQADIAEAAAHHVWLKDYTKAYDGTEPTAPGSISYFGTGVMERDGSGTPAGDALTMLSLQGEWELRISNSTKKAWLEPKEGLWLQYDLVGA